MTRKQAALRSGYERNHERPVAYGRALGEIPPTLVDTIGAITGGHVFTGYNEESIASRVKILNRSVGALVGAGVVVAAR